MTGNPLHKQSDGRKLWLKASSIFLTGFVSSCAFISLFILVFLVGKVYLQAQGVLTWEFISQPPKEGMHEGGIFPTIFGTAAVTIFMVAFALPLGVGAAVYWVEYIREGKLYRIIESAVNNLAGVPSIVYGLFGLGFFVLFIGGLMDKIAGNSSPFFRQPALLWASLTLSLLVLPVVMAATEEALKSVPKSHRAAALALGATRWQMVRKVVLPQATPGILTGAILSVARGAGETAPILFTGAAYFLPDLPLMKIGETTIPFPNLFSQFMEMAYHIFIMATQSSNPEETMPIQAGTTIVLLATVLALNMVAIVVRYKLRAKLKI